MSKFVNLVKLSVGSQTVSDLVAWQNNPRAQGADGCPRHVTRMWPKREKEIVNGGSIYWVIKGQIQCRQKIIRLDEIIGNDGIRRCAIVLDKNLILTFFDNGPGYDGDIDDLIKPYFSTKSSLGIVYSNSTRKNIHTLQLRGRTTVQPRRVR